MSRSELKLIPPPSRVARLSRTCPRCQATNYLTIERIIATPSPKKKGKYEFDATPVIRAMLIAGRDLAKIGEAGKNAPPPMATPNMPEHLS